MLVLVINSVDAGLLMMEFWDPIIRSIKDGFTAQILVECGGTGIGCYL